MNVPVKHIASVLGILVILSSFGTWVYNYHTTLATKQDVNMNNLDGRISDVETVVLIYTLIGIENLDPVSKNRYVRANARLVNLEAERDKVLGAGND